jgi:hypothetical protein
MDFKKLFHREHSELCTHNCKHKKMIHFIGALIVILIVFQAGVFVGFKKASFSYRGGDNYSRMFGERNRGIPQFPGTNMMDPSNAHGTSGKIISVQLPTIIIADNDNTEKTALVSEKTLIMNFREQMKTSDLKVNDFVVIIGTPNDEGQIEARLIRIMPTPPPNVSF